MQRLDYTKLKEITKNTQPFFCFDFDGTIADIVNHYNNVCFTSATRADLQALNQEYFISILSGRSLDDIQNIISLPNLTYAGNHGLEIQFTPNSSWEHPNVPKHQLKEIKDELNALLNKTQGVEIEDKNLSLAVHFREAKFENVDWIKHTTVKIVKSHQKLQAFAGKKVINIFPSIHWDKGKALTKIIQYHKLNGCMPIYFGDDSNDEAAFAVVNAQQGISVHVGGTGIKTIANYYIENPKTVRELIKNIS